MAWCLLLLFLQWLRLLTREVGVASKGPSHLSGSPHLKPWQVGRRCKRPKPSRWDAIQTARLR